MQLVLQKQADYFKPVRITDKEKMEQMKDGYTIFVKAKKVRNPAFHRKYFAMLKVIFDHWEPEEAEFKGIQAEKDFEQFRKDIQITAGYYDVVVNIKGEVRAKSKSIAWDKMDDHEFEELYNKVANVGLKMILTNYTWDDLERVVSEIEKFTQ